jgi:hypothetical protein
VGDEGRGLNRDELQVENTALRYSPPYSAKEGWGFTAMNFRLKTSSCDIHHLLEPRKDKLWNVGVKMGWMTGEVGAKPQ